MASQANVYAPSRWKMQILDGPRWVMTGSILGTSLAFIGVLGATLAGCSTTHKIYLLSVSAYPSDSQSAFSIRIGYRGICASTPSTDWQCHGSIAPFYNGPYSTPWTSLSDPIGLFDWMEYIRLQRFKVPGVFLLMAVAILALLTSLMAFWMLLVRDRARIAIFNLSNAANVLFNRPSNIYQHGMNERFANVLLLLSCTATVLTFTAGGWQYGASTGIVQILNERSFSEFTVHSGGQANRQVWVGAGFAALATLLIALMSRLERWRRYGYVDHIARGGNALPAHNPTHRWSKFEKWAWGWLGHKD